MIQLVLALATIIGVPIGLVTVIFVVRNGVRENRNDREKKAQADIDRAVSNATAPLTYTISTLRDALATMTKSNDYHIKKVDDLEKELRWREGK